MRTLLRRDVFHHGYKSSCFLTGAASGIGYEMGNAFAKEGAKVITDRLEERAKEAAEQLQKEGFQAIGLKCDVTSEEEIEASYLKLLLISVH